MPQPLRETTPLGEATVSKSGRMKVHAITAGLGSSGYYSPDVLREAATNGLIAKGTPLFLDHASETERPDRPERSVRDIAAVFTEAATYDDTAQALGGEIQVFAPYRDLLTEMAPHIGLSISGSATDITEGEVDGRRVPVVEGLARIDSVDWVTRAGRGGKVVELLESVRANKRAISHGVSEATVNDTREALQTLLRDTYGGNQIYVWVRDFDDTTVWFEVEAAPRTAPTPPASTARATPERQRRCRAHWRPDRGPRSAPPTSRSPGRAATTPPPRSPRRTPCPRSRRARLRELEEAAGRVTTLESERDTTAERRA